MIFLASLMIYERVHTFSSAFKNGGFCPRHCAKDEALRADQGYDRKTATEQKYFLTFHRKYGILMKNCKFE